MYTHAWPVFSCARLSAADQKDLANVMAKVPVSGERDNAKMMKAINR